MQTMSLKEKTRKESISMQGVLEWINQLLNLKLTRIQELGSGSVFCQIFEIIHSGTIPMHKVNWQAKHQHEFTTNLKLLQDAFAKTNINRPLEPLKLAKAKCTDNFELAVWLRKHYLDHIQQTDCTLNSSLSSKADFSFAHRKIVPKHFKPLVRREQDVLCECPRCLPTEQQRQIRKKICELRVKLQMIRELSISIQSVDNKIEMIKEIMSLKYN